MTFIQIKTWGGGWGGPLLMMIGDAMTPFDPTGGPV